MKKKNNIWIYSLLIAGVLLILVSRCKKDDPEPVPVPNQSALLVGSWEQVSLASSNCSDPFENGVYTCTADCEILVATTTTLTFDGDGPYTYTVNGTTITVDFGGDAKVLTFDISGTTLTIIYQNSVPDGGCKYVMTYKKAVTDVDGNIYHTVTIGTQVWMVEYLRVTKFNNGSAIPLVTDNTAWSTLTTAGYCWYNNEAAFKDTYGALYNWHAVNTGKLCPNGWHVATDDEWATLINFLGGESAASGKLKEAGTEHWQDPNTDATNESGFTALPGGTRNSDGTFWNLGLLSYWWSSTPIGPDAAWYRELFWNDAIVHRYGNSLPVGMSVRCIKD